jgi:hypothetical protein
MVTVSVAIGVVMVVSHVIVFVVRLIAVMSAEPRSVPLAWRMSIGSPMSRYCVASTRRRRGRRGAGDVASARAVAVDLAVDVLAHVLGEHARLAVQDVDEGALVAVGLLDRHLREGDALEVVLDAHDRVLVGLVARDRQGAAVHDGLPR